MKTKKSTIQKYLVLVPHNETRQLVRKYADECIKNGLKGVMRFPCVAPLMELVKPMSANELRKHSHELRENMGNEKFITDKSSKIPFALAEEELTLYGFMLERDKGLGTRDKGLLYEIISCCNQSNITNKYPVPCPLSPVPIIGIFLCNKEKSFDLPYLPKFFFKPAAVANFYIKPIKNGFKWKIGKLYWLPKKIKTDSPKK